MPGGGRGPVAISGVSMKDAKATPSPMPDKGARRQASKALRAFLALREHLRHFAEARRNATLPVDQAAPLADDARVVGAWLGIRGSRHERRRSEGRRARRRATLQHRATNSLRVRPRGPVWSGWSAYGVVPMGIAGLDLRR